MDSMSLFLMSATVVPIDTQMKLQMVFQKMVHETLCSFRYYTRHGEESLKNWRRCWRPRKRRWQKRYVSWITRMQWWKVQCTCMPKFKFWFWFIVNQVFKPLHRFWDFDNLPHQHLEQHSINTQLSVGRNVNGVLIEGRSRVLIDTRPWMPLVHVIQLLYCWIF